MNWVGGTRKRHTMKSDSKKQREFFEKRKLLQKMKHLGIPLPASPKSSSSSSMDLVTLFIVNQIAAKKENQDPPKTTHIGNFKGGARFIRNMPLELPMSPCSPSKLSLNESQPCCSVQAMRRRKHCIPNKLQYQQLSPVLESAFSDKSVSDNQPQSADPLSPFSPASYGSLGQGIDPLQLFPQQKSQTNTQLNLHYSPPPWNCSELEQDKFQPFSQPRDMADRSPLFSRSNTPRHQPDIPPVAHVLFGGSEPDGAKTGNKARHEVNFSFNQPEEPVLGFRLNQSGTYEQCGDLFRGFSNEGYGSGACPELTNCPKKCCDSSSHNSLWAAYLSADSDGVENGCRSSHLGQASIVETCYPNQSSQVAPQQGHSQPGSLTPLTKRPGNHRDQRAVENTGLFDGTCGGNDRHTGSKKPLFISFQPSPQSQSCEIHQHKLAPVETQDAGIQTTIVPARETSDTSTQYSPVQEAAKPVEFLFRAPVDISIQNSATRGQAGCRNEREEQTTPRALLDDHRKETEHTPRSKSSKEPKAWHLPVTSFVKQYPTHNTKSRITTWTPKGLSTGAQSKTIDTEMSEQDCGGADERGMTDLVEKGSPMKSLPEERDEAASARKVSRLSEETETLQEIADILLMLKQRKKEE